jgi:hypothetical protein
MGDISKTLDNFFNYLAEEKFDTVPWVVNFQPIRKRRRGCLHDTISFLYLSSPPSEGRKGVLHILYAPDKIFEKTRDKQGRIACLEKIFLHEIGHARVNLTDWYKPKLDSKNEKNRKWHLGNPSEFGPYAVSSPAEHEFMAWAYGFSARSCIKSFRSWITRLFKEIDEEWITG